MGHFPSGPKEPPHFFAILFINIQHNASVKIKIMQEEHPKSLNNRSKLEISQSITQESMLCLWSGDGELDEMHNQAGQQSIICQMEPGELDLQVLEQCDAVAEELLVDF
jgi:hypothetical protein